MKDISYIINHLGEDRESYYNAVTPPIFQTSNFAFKTVGDLRDAIAREKESFIYSRGNNPLTDILCKKISALEETQEALAFSSGMAAISSAIISFVGYGDHIVSVKNNYSWTNILMSRFLKRFGIETSFIDGKETKNFRKAIKNNTKLIYLESPSSITFEIQDIEAVSLLAREYGLVTLIDNSYSSPLTQSPAKLGVDIILHSASKYLGGHSDAVAGIVCGSSENITRIFNNEFLTLGGVLSPFNAWLILRGLRTLPARIDRISDSTSKIVAYLEKHPLVKEVLYPLSPHHPQYELAKKQMLKPMGLFSIKLAVTEKKKIELFAESLRQFIIGVSWGGHESLVFPATAFDKERSGTGNYDNLIRFSIGLDDADSLIEDIDQALRRINQSL
jgi:cystathionine beta-lyase/cystathionine gamma-synthase